MSKLVRMSDIAQRLHISTVTVSKALSGKDGVSDALRLNIQQTAEQMGYQRKTIQAERSNRFTVAVLIERYHVNRKRWWKTEKSLYKLHKNKNPSKKRKKALDKGKKMR